MKKVTVEVCSGTQCVLMGSMDIVTSIQSLQSLKHQLGINRKIEILTPKCLGYCKSGGVGPFIRINGNVLENATSETVMSHIISLISDDK